MFGAYFHIPSCINFVYPYAMHNQTIWMIKCVCSIVFSFYACACFGLCATLSCSSSLLQIELPGCGVRRWRHTAAAVRNGSSVQVVYFGGLNKDDALSATTVMSISKC